MLNKIDLPFNKSTYYLRGYRCGYSTKNLYILFQEVNESGKETLTRQTPVKGLRPSAFSWLCCCAGSLYFQSDTAVRTSVRIERIVWNTKLAVRLPLTCWLISPIFINWDSRVFLACVVAIDASQLPRVLATSAPWYKAGKGTYSLLNQELMNCVEKRMEHVL